MKFNCVKQKNIYGENLNEFNQYTPDENDVVDNRVDIDYSLVLIDLDHRDTTLMRIIQSIRHMDYKLPKNESMTLYMTHSVGDVKMFNILPYIMEFIVGLDRKINVVYRGSFNKIIGESIAKYPKINFNITKNVMDEMVIHYMNLYNYENVNLI